MPKVVDHDARRRVIIAAACKLIADSGLESVTTRRIAEETGYANGTLRYYFPGKDAVIIAAFQYIFDATNARVDTGDSPAAGLDGLRALSREIMPLDDVRLAEARIAIAFWHQALHSEDKAQLYVDVVDQWRSDLSARLDEAKADREIATDVDIPTAIDELLSMLMGLQVSAVLSPGDTSPDRQLAQLEGFIQRLR
jgi:AcrR family transcriptional regulator